MHRWNWVVVRAYAPAGFMLLAAVALDAVLSPLQANPLLAGLASITDWMPMAALAAALVLLVLPSYRLLKWHRSVGPDCPRCGGPLGHERIGRERMGGAYRRCYGCGGNINHRHYE